MQLSDSTGIARDSTLTSHTLLTKEWPGVSQMYLAVNGFPCYNSHQLLGPIFSTSSARRLLVEPLQLYRTRETGGEK